MNPPPPRRLLMTADAVGGVWHYALELCRALGDHDVEVVLATMGPRPRPDQRAGAAALANVTVVESDFRLEWMDAPWDDVAAAGQWLLELAEQHEPDVIHLNGYAHAALPWTRPVVVVAHSCVLSWWTAVRGGRAPRTWDRYRAAVRAGLDAADVVVAPTRTMLDALQAGHGPFRSGLVIPNARSAREFFPARKEPFVLGVGRWWDEAKNVAALAAAAPALDWTVRLAGDGPAPEYVVPGVEWLGSLPSLALAEQFGRASIYALPARYEPFGLSVLEAALSGCALVLGDIPSLRENWWDSARFVPPDDPAALAATLQELIADEPRRRRLAADAQFRACEFTPGRMVDAYLAAYAGARQSRQTEPAAAPAGAR